MLKRLLALAAVTTIIAIVVGAYSRGAVTQEVDEATLSGMAWQAQARGEYVVSQAKHVFYEGVDTLDGAIARYTIVEATPIAKQSYVLDDFNIGTWYKFRIDSMIKQNPLPACTSCTTITNPPGDMPLGAGEMLLIHPGGTQLVNGVTFTFTVPEFPDFNLQQKYLLFVDYDASRGVAAVSVGPPGVYRVDSYGNLSHIYEPETDDAIGSGLFTQYGNNINNFKNALNPPQPTTCDPYEEQYCYDQGGTWNASTCYCRIYDPCLRKPWLCDGNTY